MSIASKDRRQQSGLTRFSFGLSDGKLCKPKKETATTAGQKVKDNDAWQRNGRGNSWGRSMTDIGSGEKELNSYAVVIQKEAEKIQ